MHERLEVFVLVAVLIAACQPDEWELVDGTGNRETLEALGSVEHRVTLRASAGGDADGYLVLNLRAAASGAVRVTVIPDDPEMPLHELDSSAFGSSGTWHRVTRFACGENCDEGITVRVESNADDARVLVDWELAAIVKAPGDEPPTVCVGATLLASAWGDQPRFVGRRRRGQAASVRAPRLRSGRRPSRRVRVSGTDLGFLLTPDADAGAVVDDPADAAALRALRDAHGHFTLVADGTGVVVAIVDVIPHVNEEGKLRPPFPIRLERG